MHLFLLLQFFFLTIIQCAIEWNGNKISHSTETAQQFFFILTLISFSFSLFLYFFPFVSSPFHCCCCPLPWKKHIFWLQQHAGDAHSKCISKHFRKKASGGNVNDKVSVSVHYRANNSRSPLFCGLSIEKQSIFNL